MTTQRMQRLLLALLTVQHCSPTGGGAGLQGRIQGVEGFTAP